MSENVRKINRIRNSKIIYMVLTSILFFILLPVTAKADDFSTAPIIVSVSPSNYGPIKITGKFVKGETMVSFNLPHGKEVECRYFGEGDANPFRTESKVDKLELTYGQNLIMEDSLYSICMGTVINYNFDGNLDSPDDEPILNIRISRDTDNFDRVTGIGLNPTSLDLRAGRTVDLKADLISCESNDSKPYDDTVFWSSTNSSVAEVNADGRVTAKKEGRAVIKVKTLDGGYENICHVTVKGTPEPQKEYTNVGEKEPAKSVDCDIYKSEVPYGTASVTNTNSKIGDLKVHKLDARVEANQKILVDCYAINLGKSARILTTVSVHPRRELGVDNGIRETLIYANLEKKVQTVYAVCYNQTDKAYYLMGTLDENGVARFPNFILRDATNITIFVLE